MTENPTGADNPEPVPGSVPPHGEPEAAPEQPEEAVEAGTVQEQLALAVNKLPANRLGWEHKKETYRAKADAGSVHGMAQLLAAMSGRFDFAKKLVADAVISDEVSLKAANDFLKMDKVVCMMLVGQAKLIPGKGYVDLEGNILLAH